MNPRHLHTDPALRRVLYLKSLHFAPATGAARRFSRMLCGSRRRMIRTHIRSAHPMTLQQLRRIANCLLGRCVLAWLALSMGVAAAAPLIQSQGFELICTSTGAVKLIVKGEDGGSALGAGHLDCPMCLPHAAPPPPALQLPPPTESPLWHAQQPVERARIAAITAAPLPARGPPPAYL